MPINILLNQTLISSLSSNVRTSCLSSNSNRSVSRCCPQPVNSRLMLNQLQYNKLQPSWPKHVPFVPKNTPQPDKDNGQGRALLVPANNERAVVVLHLKTMLRICDQTNFGFVILKRIKLICLKPIVYNATKLMKLVL